MKLAHFAAVRRQEPMVKRSIRIPVRVDSALRVRARVAGLSLAELTVEVLERGLDLYDARQGWGLVDCDGACDNNAQRAG